MSKTIQHIKTIIISLLSVLMLFSCQPDWTGGLEPDLNYANSSFPDRLANEETRRVLLLYSAGFNSLSSYLKKDIEDLQKGWLPSDRRTENVVLVYSHFPASGGGYKTPTSPSLVRLYRDRNSEIQADTLVVYPEGTISSSAKQLNKVLTYVKDNFKAKSYGMLFSSHATGYLPAGYYQNSLNAYKTTTWKAMGYQELTGVPYVEPEYDPSLPMVKSIGQDQVGSVGSYTSYEIELTDFVKAIPMELDYIMFDTCLMGGIEVAYELKSKVHKVGFSQTEVLAEGFCYETLVSHLLQGSEADPQSVCEDYFKQYEIQSGVYRSATISLIDCSRLGSLAQTCKKLFSDYSSQIKSLNYKSVQRFYRSDKHWFYDLESILLNAGITKEEQNELYAALDECVIYKAHTPKFMEEFSIHTYSGFSMYLPSHGSDNLDSFYKTLKWNKDTGLVN